MYSVEMPADKWYVVIVKFSQEAKTAGVQANICGSR